MSGCCKAEASKAMRSKISSKNCSWCPLPLTRFQCLNELFLILWRYGWHKTPVVCFYLSSKYSLFAFKLFHLLSAMPLHFLLSCSNVNSRLYWYWLTKCANTYTLVLREHLKPRPLVISSNIFLHSSFVDINSSNLV